MRANGRPFGNVANTAFYCYVIADMTDSLKQDAKFAGLRITPDGEGYFGYNGHVYWDFNPAYEDLRLRLQKKSPCSASKV